MEGLVAVVSGGSELQLRLARLTGCEEWGRGMSGNLIPNQSRQALAAKSLT